MFDPADYPHLRHAPATARNREPIARALLPELEPQARVLEIASGTGEHGIWFAARRPDITWHLTDADADYREAAQGWKEAAQLSNVTGPHPLDVTRSDEWVHWAGEVDALFCANMIHISPLSATPGLFLGAAHVLDTGAPLFLYGPLLDGENTAPSNLSFDESLRARNAEWGVRALEAVEAVAGDCGFALDRRWDLPANNLLLRFTRQKVVS